MCDFPALKCWGWPATEKADTWQIRNVLKKFFKQSLEIEEIKKNGDAYGKKALMFVL